MCRTAAAVGVWALLVGLLTTTAGAQTAQPPTPPPAASIGADVMVDIDGAGTIELGARELSTYLVAETAGRLDEVELHQRRIVDGGLHLRMLYAGDLLGAPFYFGQASLTDPVSGTRYAGLAVGADSSGPGGARTLDAAIVTGSGDIVPFTLTVQPPPRRGLPVWDDDPCDDLPQLGRFAEVIDRWVQQDQATPFEPGRTVFTGSSSIRFWTRLQRDLGDWAPIQRGFGGSFLSEVADLADELVLVHDPGAVVVFAGTNDIEVGVAPDDVVDSYRCLVQRIGDGLGDVPVSFIAITPTPARWPTWDQANEVNDEVASLAVQWPDLHFIDTRDAFLDTGQPPSADLFIADGLHLSDAGYDIWEDEVKAHLDAVVEPVIIEPGPLAQGDQVLIDLGPTSAGDGGPTPSPDGFGRHWNSWAATDATERMTAGEHLGELVDTDGHPAGVRLSLAGIDSQAVGIRAGGLLAPDPGLLGDLAVPTATQDYFASLGNPGVLMLEGLDPDDRYQLRLFASRDHPSVRTTRYRVRGDGAAEGELVTSGPGSGAQPGSTGNDDDIVVLSDLEPDRWGRLQIEFIAEDSIFAYLSLLELTVTDGDAPPCGSGGDLTPGVQQRTFTTSSGDERTYLLTVPSTYTEGVEADVLFNFHGLGSNAGEQYVYGNFVDQAERDGVILVTPDARANTEGVRGWDSSAGPGNPEVAFVLELIDELETQYCLDDYFAAGMSSGGGMSSALGCRADAPFDGVGPVTLVRFNATDCADTEPRKIVYFHGTDDAVVPFSIAEPRMQEWAEHNRCDPEPIEERISSEVVRFRWEGCEAETSWYKIEGGGHTWPGSLDIPFLGYTTQDISASDIIWDLFFG